MVTAVALVAVTVSVDALPDAIEDGLAVIVTFGIGGCVTVMVTGRDVALPPAPFAVAVYVVVEVGETTCGPPVAAGSV
jgi:hypothetical protein